MAKPGGFGSERWRWFGREEISRGGFVFGGVDRGQLDSGQRVWVDWASGLDICYLGPKCGSG